MKWYQKVKELIRNSPCPQVKAFAQRNELSVEQLKPHMVQRWIYNVKEIVKKVDERPKSNMRRHCE